MHRLARFLFLSSFLSLSVDELCNKQMNRHIISSKTKIFSIKSWSKLTKLFLMTIISSDHKKYIFSKKIYHVHGYGKRFAVIKDLTPLIRVPMDSASFYHPYQLKTTFQISQACNMINKSIRIDMYYITHLFLPQ